MEIMKHNEKSHIMGSLKGEEKEKGKVYLKQYGRNLSILRRMDTCDP